MGVGGGVRERKGKEKGKGREGELAARFVFNFGLFSMQWEVEGVSGRVGGGGKEGGEAVCEMAFRVRKWSNGRKCSRFYVRG